MHTPIRLLTLLALAIAPLQAADQAPPPIQQGTGHHFACTDYSGNKVFLVNPEGKATWEYPAKNCNDLWILPSGNLLFNTGHGVKEVTRDKKVVFQYDSKSEIYSCQRLENGDTFIAECNSGRLIEVKPDGTIAKEVKLLPDGKDGGHAYIRNARKLDNGHYLVAHYGQQKVVEYSANGDIVRTIPAPGGPHSTCRLANGNTLIACGDQVKAAQVIEVDPKGQIAWSVTSEELPGISLKLMTGFHRLPNGNTVMTNWLGHGQFGKAPHIIEVTRDKKVVWTFSDFKTMRTVSNVFILDTPAKGNH